MRKRNCLGWITSLVLLFTIQPSYSCCYFEGKELVQNCRSHLRGLVLNGDGAPLDKTHFFEPATKGTGVNRGFLGRPRAEEPDQRLRSLLLCVRQERLHHRAAEQRYEVAPFQLTELHTLPVAPRLRQHSGFERTPSGLAALRDFDLVHVSLGSFAT